MFLSLIHPLKKRILYGFLASNLPLMIRKVLIALFNDKVVFLPSLHSITACWSFDDLTREAESRRLKVE
jgi:hypothetical protein